MATSAGTVRNYAANPTLQTWDLSDMLVLKEILEV
jgi:hypothetical protein